MHPKYTFSPTTAKTQLFVSAAFGFMIMFGIHYITHRRPDSVIYPDLATGAPP